MDNSYHSNAIYIKRLYVNNTFSDQLLKTATSNKVDVLYNCIIICIIHGYGKRCTVGYKLLLSRMGAAKFKLVICCVTRYHMVT